MMKLATNLKVQLVQAAYVLTYPALKLMNLKTPEKQLNGEYHIAVQGFLNGYSSENVDLLLRQARLESGKGWGNKATTQDNNPFGMGIVKKRPTTQLGARPAQDGTGVNYIGGYSTIGSGVADRFLWDNFNKVSPKSSQYVDAVIAAGYNQNTQYQFSWLNTKDTSLTVRKIHLAMLSMIVAGFLAVQFLKGKKWL
jgi:hypothetical protein